MVCTLWVSSFELTFALVLPMKFLFLPLSWLFGFITYLRNLMYDRGILASYHSKLKTIVVGNLQVGGAGKTPQTAYLYDCLSAEYKTAILSRGYGRKTSGLIEADENSTAESIGDEPLWYKRVLKQVRVVVSENRKNGLMYLEKTDTELVLLDDAFQHRAITGKINLLLTDYNTPYYRDYPLPYGRLREYRTGDKRADMIIVSKCPENLSLQKKVDIIQSVNPYDHQHVFFTSVHPGKPYVLKGDKDFGDIRYNQLIVLSGIANPDSLMSLCAQFNRELLPMHFKDHHKYTVQDIKKLLTMIAPDTLVITTEKDAVKLGDKNFLEILPENKVFVLPIKTHFLFQEDKRFKDCIKELL